jgi:hypothetical protein
MACADTFCHNTLSSGDPFTITGRLYVPLKVDAAVLRSSPSFGALWPWHVKQYCWKIGRTSFSKRGPTVSAPAGASNTKRIPDANEDRGIVAKASLRGADRIPIQARL